MRTGELDDDWYDPAIYPELRAAPPWVMEDMIEVQVSIPEQLPNTLVDTAPRFVDALQDVVRAGQPVVVTGVGTAGHAARAVSLLLNDVVTGSPLGRPGPAEFRESSDQALSPRSGGLCLAVSHGGRSRSTLAALEAARESGATTALITAAVNSPVADAADMVLPTPVQDQSYCHTVGYTSPMLAAMFLGSTLWREPFPAEALTSYLRELRALEPRAAQVARGLRDARRIVASGSLIDQPTACELALKVAEGPRLPTTALGLEDTQHGHLVGHDHDSGLIAIATGDTNSRRSGERAHELVRAAGHIGLVTAAIVSPEIADSVDPEATAAGVLALPDTELPSSWSSLLGGALCLQQLTVALAHDRGVNPDLIRREERPYREAVALGAAKEPRT